MLSCTSPSGHRTDHPEASCPGSGTTGTQPGKGGEGRGTGQGWGGRGPGQAGGPAHGFLAQGPPVPSRPSCHWPHPGARRGALHSLPGVAQPPHTGGSGPGSEDARLTLLPDSWGEPWPSAPLR